MTTRTALAAVVVAAFALASCASDDADDTDPIDSTTTEQPSATPTTADPDDTDDEADATDEAAWVALADAPLELTENDAEAFDGELWVVGGLTADAAVSDDVLVYDPATDTWREGPSLPEPVHHARLVATDDDLVLIGGYRTLAFDAVDDVWVLNDERDGWVPGPPLPAARGAGGAAWDGERIVFGGGMDDDGLTADVFALDSLDGEWERIGELSIARDHLDATSDGAGTVWFLAGREMALTANLGAVDLLVGDTIEVIGELPTPRGGVAAFYSPTHGACLAGGEEPDSTFDEVECIDAEGEITVLAPLGVARHGLGAGVIDGVAYVALGGPEPMLAVSPTLEALELGD
ncbi:MAG: hypothetical protein JJU45_00355 [Acidimicrobiia bacterium]|nr:hypothetical protein [Acidimicrobiia bacterium]